MSSHPKILVCGGSGIGKTSLIMTTPEQGKKSLLLSMEGGTASIEGPKTRHLFLDEEKPRMALGSDIAKEAGRPYAEDFDEEQYEGIVVHIDGIAELEDVLSWIAPSFSIADEGEPYSIQRKQKMNDYFGFSFEDKFKGWTIGLDSYSKAATLLFQRAERKERAKTKKGGAENGFAKYGNAKNDALWLVDNFVERYDGPIIMLALTEEKVNEALGFNQTFIQSFSRAAAGRVAPSFNQVFYMGLGSYEQRDDEGVVTDVQEFRYLRTAKTDDETKPGFGLELKDRSHTLKDIEAPDMSTVFGKIYSGKKTKKIVRQLPPGLQ